MRFFLIFMALVLSGKTYAACDGGACKLIIDVLKNEEFQHPVFTASKSLEIGDSVILKAGTEFASVVSYSDVMHVGKNVSFGNLYQQGVLLLQKPANIHGKIYARAPDNNETDLITTGFNYPNIPQTNLTSIIDLPTRKSNSAITIDKGNTQALDPGQYGKVSIPQGKLQLASGIYFFDNLNVGAKGEIEMDNKDGTVFVFVLEDLRFSGLMNFKSVKSDLLLGYFGKKPIIIDGKFDAYLVAPEASVTLLPAPDKKFHHLSIFAQSIDVASDTRVVRAIPAYRGAAFKEISDRNRMPDEDVYDIAHDPQYLRRLEDSPNGKLMLAAIDNLWAMDPEGIAAYQEMLELLRQNPEETIATFDQIFAEIPDKLDSIADRRNMTMLLADLRLNEATDLLSEVGTRPVSQEIMAAHSGPHDSSLTQEYSIRGMALNGLKRLAMNGHVEADQLLLNSTLDNHDEVIRDSAAVAYLLSGNIEEKREQLRNLLPASDQHLANITFDVEPLNKQLESRQQEKPIKHDHSNHSNNDIPLEIQND